MNATDCPGNFRSLQECRRGAVLVAVIICVALVSVVFASVVKMAAVGRQTARIETWRIQAAWLAESGLERAAARLAADATYRGETWTVAAEQLDGSHDAVVEIEVETIPEQPERRLVRTRADYPNHAHHRCRQGRQVVVELP